MWGWNVIRDECQAIGLYIFSTRHFGDGEGLFKLCGQGQSRIIHLLHEIEAICIAISKLGYVSFFADLYEERE